MEFKITHETTLYDLQEYCKSQKSCETCSLKRDSGLSCEINYYPPWYWGITKPKTYKEDLLEKYPNVFISDKGTPAICRDLLYYGETAPCLRNDKLCVECWNEIMEEEDE